MKAINVEVKSLEIRGTEDGNIHVLASLNEINNPLGFKIDTLEQLNSLFKTFSFEPLNNIKFMRVIVDDNNNAVAFAHITKDQSFQIPVPVQAEEDDS